MTTYIVKASQFIRGVAIVQPADGAPTGETARLCEAFSGGKYSYREHGYRMSAVTLKYFTKAARLGCKSRDGATVEWESPDGERFATFDPKHPQRALAAIAIRP